MRPYRAALLGSLVCSVALANPELEEPGPQSLTLRMTAQTQAAVDGGTLVRGGSAELIARFQAPAVSPPTVARLWLQPLAGAIQSSHSGVQQKPTGNRPAGSVFVEIPLANVQPNTPVEVPFTLSLPGTFATGVEVELQLTGNAQSLGFASLHFAFDTQGRASLAAPQEIAAAQAKKIETDANTQVSVLRAARVVPFDEQAHAAALAEDSLPATLPGRQSR